VAAPPKAPVLRPFPAPKEEEPTPEPSGPYIPASVTLPEITAKAVMLGIVLAVLLGAANTYLGLKAGLTVAASIPAAVMSLAVLRMFRKHNILENNMVQTIASAGTSVASGAIFTIPALLIMGYWERLEYWETTFVIITGGLLGVLFSVPIRRALIVEEKLPFPEGKATGEVLKTGAKGGSGVGALLLGGALGGFYKIFQGGFRGWHEDPTATLRLGGGSVMGVGANLQPALLGVGVIIGLRIAALVFLGGVLGWVIGIPLYSLFAADAQPGGSLFLRAGSEEGLPATIWSLRIRYIGVGAMLVGGVWSLVKLRKPLTRAIVQGVKAARGGQKGDEVPRTERDLPFSIVGLGAIILAVPMSLLFYSFSGDFAVALAMAVIMLITGFLFSAVGGYMAGLVGSSNTPISGVTILALLAACFALLAFGVTAEIGPPTAILVAGVIAVAGSIAGDNLQDLKAGHMLGATPRKQQLMLMVGGIASAFAVAPVIQTLIDSEAAKGLVTEATPLGSIAAPQANLMAALSSGLFSTAGLADQQVMIWIGAGLAVALIVADKMLQKAGSTFRTPVMPVAVGIYLPVGLSVPIFIGGLAAWAADFYHYRRGDAMAKAAKAADRVRTTKAWEVMRENGGKMAILFASGLIAGEAVLGIGTAFLGANGLTLGFDLGDRHVWAGFLIMGYVTFLAWYVAVRGAMMRPPPS
jgi:putative OPT family oligopeptide transporter